MRTDEAGGERTPASGPGGEGEVSLVFGLVPHQGLVVLRRSADGAVIDGNSDWVERWDASFMDWADSGSEDRAALRAGAHPSGLRWPGGEYDAADLDGEPLGEGQEVIRPGDDLGEGRRHYFISEYEEERVRERAAIAGVPLARDDDLVRRRGSVFGACACVLRERAVGPTADFSRVYNMVSSVSREAQIIGSDGSWSLVVCPHEVDAGDGYAWVDTWDYALDDAADIVRTFSEDDYTVNVIEADVAQISRALRDSGVVELEALAEEVEERLEGGLDDRDDDEEALD